MEGGVGQARFKTGDDTVQFFGMKLLLAGGMVGEEKERVLFPSSLAVLPEPRLNPVQFPQEPACEGTEGMIVHGRVR